MQPQTDLSVLSKSSGASNFGTASTAASIPRPPLRWKTRVLLPGIIVLTFLSLLGYTMRDSLIPVTQVQVLPVVVKASTGGGASGIVAQAAGWVEPDPYPISVSALTDGIIKEVLVLEGQRVKAGEVVARLIDDDAKLTLESAEAELVHHQHDLTEYDAIVKAAQSEWDHPVDRNRAVKVAASMIAQAKADLAANDAEVAVESGKFSELEEQYRREKIASDAKAFPESSSVLTGLKFQTQRASVTLAKAKRESLAAKIPQLEAELAAAQENLKLRILESKELAVASAKRAAEASLVETIRVKRDEAKLRLARIEIRSPVDGVVLERMAEPGGKLFVNMNERNSAVAVKLYDPKKLQIRVDVPLADAAKVLIGERARITVEVLRDVVFDGKVTRVNHQADIQKNTLQFKVAIETPREELKPEMLARVQFFAIEKPASTEKDPSERIFAKESLIKMNGDQGTAWIWDKGKGTAQQRSVTLGNAKLNGWIEVTTGLQPGDALIEGDTSNLKDGQRIRAVEDSTPDAPATQAPAAEHKH